MRRTSFPPGLARGAFVEVQAALVANSPLAGTRLHWAELEVDAAFPEPLPGQFVMLTPPGATEAGVILPRPFSIARAQPKNGGWRLGILYVPIGRGTRLMALDRSGPWTLLGPLGRGFPTDHAGPALLVGGGRGTAPLVFLAEYFEARGRAVEFLIGARSRLDWAGPAEMGAALTRSRIWATSEDGSVGTRGRVLDLFEREPELAAALARPGAALQACGPHGLLAAAGALGESRGVPVHVSVEAHMACGTGICRSCMIPRSAAGPRPRPGSNATYLVSCLEGPVVPAACVDWARDREIAAAARDAELAAACTGRNGGPA